MQRLIFEEPASGVRKIVLATNIAETSITINDVAFVIDCGKAKETSYDALNNTPCLLPSWISKVSAQQVLLLFSGLIAFEDQIIVLTVNKSTRVNIGHMDMY